MFRRLEEPPGGGLVFEWARKFIPIITFKIGR